MRKTIGVLAAFAGVLFACQAVAEDLIKVEVRVIDVNRTKLHAVGLDWGRLLEGRADVPSPAGPLEALEGVPPKIDKLGTFTRGQIDAFLRFVEDHNYGRLLAEPKLVTMGGSTANFQVGGELPVVSQDSQGRTSVEWKPYGVHLTITPVRKDQLIRARVRAEASDVDPQHAVSLPNGTYMPAIKNRWAEADVEMENRSTIMIAGLLQSNDVTITKGLPVLMDLPLLGWLFRSTKLQHDESELVIFVTPTFVTAQVGVAGK